MQKAAARSRAKVTGKMKIEEIKELMKEMAETGVAELQYEEGDVSLHLCTKDAPRRESAGSAVSAPVAREPQAEAASITAAKSADNSQDRVGEAAASENGSIRNTEQDSPKQEGRLVTSPLVGTFYTSAAPGEPPCVKEGDKVKKGQVLGIIEAMKLMNEVESEFEGVVAEVLVKNEQVVEYGQPLFRIV